MKHKINLILGKVSIKTLQADGYFPKANKFYSRLNFHHSFFNLTFRVLPVTFTDCPTFRSEFCSFFVRTVHKIRIRRLITVYFVKNQMPYRLVAKMRQVVKNWWLRNNNINIPLRNKARASYFVIYTGALG